MSAAGIIVNGKVELETPTHWPDGSRVIVELAEPFEPEDRETHLAILRESIEDMKAGRGVPLEIAMEELSRQFNLPPCDPE